MVISTKGRYALRLMIDLAQHCDEGFISLKTVSQRQDVSLKYMERSRRRSTARTSSSASAARRAATV